jgi:hypothetical protein
MPAPNGSASTPVSVHNTEAAESCAQPFWVDEHGIRRLKVRCLGPSTSAAPVPALPSVTPVPSSDRKQAVDCTNPFWIDQDSIKRLKPQCL